MGVDNLVEVGGRVGVDGLVGVGGKEGGPSAPLHPWKRPADLIQRFDTQDVGL